MSTVNLYDVLNVPEDATKKEIKEAYRELVREFHPDKNKHKSDDTCKEMFKLITHAYNVLHNDKTRMEYDKMYAVSKQSESDHYNLKAQADAFLSAQGTDVTTLSKEEQTNEFKKAYAQMDMKHGIGRNDEDLDAIPTVEAGRKLDDLLLARSQDDIECIPDKLFNDGTFDPIKFNAAFEHMNKGPTDMIPHQGNPSAWTGFDGAGTFSSFNNFDNLYLEEGEDLGLQGTTFGTAIGDYKPVNLTQDDIQDIDTNDLFNSHNKLEKNYDDIIQERLMERQNFDSTLDDREFDDFDNDCAGYGVHEGLGFEKTSNLSWDDSGDVQKRYQRLLELRRQNASK